MHQSRLEAAFHIEPESFMAGFVKTVLTFHWLTTLLLMGLSGLLFGLVSLNIISLLHANFSFVLQHGAMAFMHGALYQSIELLAYGALSLPLWLLFKACEDVLVRKMLD
jgi:hypothetical protein